MRQIVSEQRRLEIEAACLRLVTCYCRSIDLHDYEGVLSVFAPEGVWNHAEKGPLHGHGAIRAFLTSPERSNGKALMRHVVSNLQVGIVDDTHAKGVCCWTAYLAMNVRADGTASARPPVSVGEYHDEFVFDGREWRIAARTMRYVCRGVPDKEAT